MATAVERYLDQLADDDAADHRNGYYRRHLLTELDIELQVFRTRRYGPTEVILRLCATPAGDRPRDPRRLSYSGRRPRKGARRC
jgi:hypothetical protein